MICYANPRFGNDATAQPDSRAVPWQTVEAAEAYLREAKRAAFAANPACNENWQVVLTFRPLPPVTAPEAGQT
jgi:hypothetical protein